MKDRAWIEVDLQNLRHNTAVLHGAIPEGCRLMAVVKANGYGHGAQAIAAHLEQLGITAFAVATIDEGIALRKAGIRSEILILGYTAPCRAAELSAFGLMQTLISYDYAIELAQQGYTIKVHIKIDTGMHRLGLEHSDAEAVAACFSLRHLRVEGIFSHLCVSDSLNKQDVDFTQLQIDRFYKLLDQLAAKVLSIPKTHLQSSYGLLNYPELQCSYVRVGVALYGVHSRQDMHTKLRLELRPVLSLKARVVQIRTVPAGDTAGYGRCFAPQKDSRIAMLPIGYADGIPRSLSCGKGYVLIRGHKAPFAGRICMDQLAVDVTSIPGVKVGDVATLIGRDGDHKITAAELAEKNGSITNELLSCLGRRLEIVCPFPSR